MVTTRRQATPEDIITVYRNVARDFIAGELDAGRRPPTQEEVMKMLAAPERGLLPASEFERHRPGIAHAVAAELERSL